MNIWMDTLFRPLQPDAEKNYRFIPKADEVLVGHAHHGHIIDAPEVCRQTGARLLDLQMPVGVRAARVPDAQIVETRGHERIACGEHCSVETVPPFMDVFILIV